MKKKQESKDRWIVSITNYSMSTPESWLKRKYEIQEQDKEFHYCYFT